MLTVCKHRGPYEYPNYCSYSKLLDECYVLAHSAVKLDVEML